jgi:hypothetical protein
MVSAEGRGDEVESTKFSVGNCPEELFGIKSLVLGLPTQLHSRTDLVLGELCCKDVFCSSRRILVLASSSLLLVL